MTSTSPGTSNQKQLSVFVDTNVFVARMDDQDLTHKDVVQLTHALPDDTLLFTSTQIVSESLTVITQKLGKQTAAALLDEFLSTDITIIYIDETIFKTPLLLFDKIKSKNVSFADYTSFVIFEQFKLDGVFTFDNHFKKQGIPILSDVLSSFK